MNERSEPLSCESFQEILNILFCQFFLMPKNMDRNWGGNPIFFNQENDREYTGNISVKKNHKKMTGVLYG